jgi:hypothetical protein
MIQFIDVTIQPLHMLTDLSANARCAAEAVLLRHAHLKQLMPASDQDCRLLCCHIKQGTHFRTDGIAKVGQYLSVRSVFANLSAALARSRVCRGLTATTGSFAATNGRWIRLPLARRVTV